MKHEPIHPQERQAQNAAVAKKRSHQDIVETFTTNGRRHYKGRKEERHLVSGLVQNACKDAIRENAAKAFFPSQEKERLEKEREENN